MMLYERYNLSALGITLGMICIGLLGGFLLASLTFKQIAGMGDRLHNMTAADKIAALIGVIMGLLLSVLLLQYIRDWAGESGPLLGVLTVLFLVFFCVWAMMSMKDELRFYFPGLSQIKEAEEKELQRPKLLDTNVIIDGRIADVCRAGFVEGKIYIPSFVLEELQHIADSPDNLRRARGRRGLDILNAMRKELELQVKQDDPADPENPDEVDSRLVRMAKDLEGSIVTNDFNLNKVAELQGVPVLNINELANALKPVVLPGEEMSVPVIKEGKEPSQGVAYLDDGTMVVIEGGRRFIGETVDVIVTSVLQTVAGKMIFANIKADQEQEDQIIDRNVRDYSGFRPRKKTR
ncbi:MAG: TRAM domain-containing protein [Armatimonadetes bacterium]|nr:TRAM domain-containing protein [Armatimonadota bacterium]